MERYSASVEDLEIGSCFLHFQEIKEEPRNMHQPVVDRRESGQPAQSASAYPLSLSWRVEDEVKIKPRPIVPRR